MPITVPGVCRFALQGRHSNGNPVINVLDYQIDTTGSATPRNERIFELADDIAQNWQSQILDRLCDNYTFEGVRFVDLDEADGITGGVGPNSGEPVVGQVATAAEAPQVAVKIRKVITAPRGIRDGRMYLGPVSSSDVDENGFVTPADRALYTGAAEAFRLNTENTEGIGGSVWSRMVVVHFDAPRPPVGTPDNRVGEFIAVEGMFCEPKSGTIRRRNT